ncbi:LacI family DNA-binding transcriptional regulator [Ruminococcus flavefaciens]|uniref:LacI family DNA-binding transcriptional regulator n=1 Tax=Ruminococcus flavefaciens TaxID=1265 RepID=UPI0026EB4FF6|nr:LacI family DNA-binding transcriptional regulator [Ruminococcus flavefaciens]MDD7517953.1 LacI family DNA-binding transcriptional regulator [Ruminococcus flavefaciens]MDY5692857.1 LacI family DNA-binding transcriptional regulator [Ruminococcus flavefaciens]
MKNGVKMLDIATKLGVSVVTVSNALAGRDGVSEQMRKRICETAEKMGYKPSNTKSEKRRMTIPKISKNVGILTSERFVGARGTFYWELTASISNQLSQMNVCTVYECVTAESERDGILPNMIIDGKVDGVIVIGQVHRSYIECLSKLTIPLIFVDFYDNRYKIDSVISDSFNGGYMLTDYLVSKGHRRIGFFGTLNATSSINDRYLGYIKCIMENELDFRIEWIIGDRNEKGILNEKIDFPDDMPTAFVCNCDETAFRVISALKTKGVRVPDDISVVGYDNYTVSSICIPTITTVEVDLAKMAEVSVGIMAKKLADPTYTEGRRIISGRLIEKESVLDIRGSYNRE